MNSRHILRTRSLLLISSAFQHAPTMIPGLFSPSSITPSNFPPSRCNLTLHRFAPSGVRIFTAPPRLRCAAIAGLTSIIRSNVALRLGVRGVGACLASSRAGRTRETGGLGVRKPVMDRGESGARRCGNEVAVGVVWGWSRKP